MRFPIQITAMTMAVLLAGCAASSLKQTWKSPNAPGQPLQKIAVVAVDEREMIRNPIENFFAHALRARGQEATVTHELMSLSEIKADREAAAAKLQAAGADSVLIVRLADSKTLSSQIRVDQERYVATLSGGGDYLGWYDYYSVAYADMGSVWSSDRKMIYLESSLYELPAGQRVWSALTRTVLDAGRTDPLVEIEAVTTLVAGAMRQDGVIK